MNSSFDKAIDFVLANEGGYVNHAADPGGATNFGISLRTLHELEGDQYDKWDLDFDGDIDADDMRLLTVEMARDFYETHFWHPIFEKVNEQSVATKLLDMCVNMGTRQAAKILQRSCNWNMPMLKVDGSIGPNTISAVNTMGDTLEYFIPSEQAKFYFTLVDAKPSRGVFLLGWLRRAYHWPT